MSENYYQHKDGGVYKLIGFSRSTVDLTNWAVYLHIWPFEQSLWNRPIEEWVDGRFKELDLTEMLLVTNEDQAAAQARITAARAARKQAEEK